MWPVQNATCSVCGKYSSTFRFNSSSPIYRIGTCSSGQTLVASRISNSKSSWFASGMVWIPNFHLGYAPFSMASHRSFRWKSGSCPAIFNASSHTRLCTPSSGVQWNLTKWRSPFLLIRVKVLTPNPCIMRYERGIARSDIAHVYMCVASLCR